MSTNEIPVDLAAVQADDALLDRFAPESFEKWLARINDDFQRRVADALDVEAALIVLRRDVDAEPIGQMVDTRTALAAINSGRKPAGPRQVPWWVWLLLMFVNGAAFFALIEAVT